MARGKWGVRTWSRVFALFFCDAAAYGKLVICWLSISLARGTVDGILNGMLGGGVGYFTGSEVVCSFVRNDNGERADKVVGIAGVDVFLFKGGRGIRAVTRSIMTNAEAGH